MSKGSFNHRLKRLGNDSIGIEHVQMLSCDRSLNGTVYQLFPNPQCVRCGKYLEVISSLLEVVHGLKEDNSSFK